MEQDLVEFLNDHLETARMYGVNDELLEIKFKEAVINPSRNQLILTTDSGSEFVFTLKSVFK